MFIQNLNKRQQSVLLHYADAVMRADNMIDSSELVAMEVLRKQAHSSVEPEELPIENLGDVFVNRIGRVSFLLELVGMAYVNDDFDPRQSALIEQIAGALDLLHDGTLKTVNQWIRSQFSLMKSAQDLMQGI